MEDRMPALEPRMKWSGGTQAQEGLQALLISDIKMSKRDDIATYTLYFEQIGGEAEGGRATASFWMGRDDMIFGIEQLAGVILAAGMWDKIPKPLKDAENWRKENEKILLWLKDHVEGKTVGGEVVHKEGTGEYEGSYSAKVVEVMSYADYKAKSGAVTPPNASPGLSNEPEDEDPDGW
jgi:hypothetical protein